jgi:hypothetical protein
LKKLVLCAYKLRSVVGSKQTVRTDGTVHVEKAEIKKKGTSNILNYGSF